MEQSERRQWWVVPRGETMKHIFFPITFLFFSFKRYQGDLLKWCFFVLVCVLGRLFVLHELSLPVITMRTMRTWCQHGTMSKENKRKHNEHNEPMFANRKARVARSSVIA